MEQYDAAAVTNGAYKYLRWFCFEFVFCIIKTLRPVYQTCKQSEAVENRPYVLYCCTYLLNLHPLNDLSR